MHTIQIPGSRGPQIDNLGHSCPFNLKFEVAGCFQRSSGGDKFHRKLPRGPVTPGLTEYHCPDCDEEVTWGFVADFDGSVSFGTIFVKEIPCD